MAATLRPGRRRGIGRTGDLRLIKMGEEAPRERVYGRDVTRRQVIDIGLPLVLAAVAVAEVATSSDIDAPLPIVALFALGTTLPLFWRRQAPLIVLVATLGLRRDPGCDARHREQRERAVRRGPLRRLRERGLHEPPRRPDRRRDHRRDGGDHGGRDRRGRRSGTWSSSGDPVRRVGRRDGRAQPAGARRRPRRAHRRARARARGEGEARRRPRSGRGSRASCTTWSRTTCRSWSCRRAPSGAPSATSGRRPARCSRRSRRPAAPRWPRCAACSACCAAPTTSSRSRRSRACATSTTWSSRFARPGMPVDLRIEGEPRPLAARDRPVRVPHRPGGTHQRAQARRPGAGPRDRPLRRQRARHRDRRRRHGRRRRRRRRAATASSGCASASPCSVATWPRAGAASGGYAVRARLPLAGGAP